MTSDAGPEPSAKSICKVTICIATYRRPHGLRALLESLNALMIDDAQVSLIIVENCPEDTAESHLGDVSSLSKWPLRYVVEYERGIVAARNRALTEVAADTDYIGFLDDDETVSPTWLSAMLRTAKDTSATAVQGPVIPSYETTPPAWAVHSGLFELGPFQPNQALNFASTNNVLISGDFLRKQQPQFDPLFNTTGGEDEEFFLRLQRAGGVIHAAHDARVTDIVPKARLTLEWALRRKFRMGNTLGRIALLHKEGRALRFLKGIGAFGKGVGMVCTLGLGSKTKMVQGLLELVRGLGVMAAFTGLAFQEYSPSAVIKDRSKLAP